MNDAERKLIERFPWLTEADLQKLAKRPWLRLYLDADDESLDEAAERHRLAQTEAREELKKRGKVALRRVSVRGLQTTMLHDPPRSSRPRNRGALMAVYGVKVEEGGVVLRGVGVPFHEWTVVADKDGQLFSEIWDEESIPKPPVGIPMLLSHNRDLPPLGVVEESFITKHGLGVEVRLVGNDHELEGIRRRLAAGLMTGLSVGFQAGTPVWEKPPERGMPPGKRVRGAKIVELSSVNYPAFPSAGALSVNQRSGREEEAHRQSVEAHEKTQEVIAWVAARKAAAASKSK